MCGIVTASPRIPIAFMKASASRAVFAGNGTITASSSSAANAALWSSGERVFLSGQPVTPNSVASRETARKRYVRTSSSGEMCPIDSSPPTEQYVQSDRVRPARTRVASPCAPIASVTCGTSVKSFVSRKSCATSAIDFGWQATFAIAPAGPESSRHFRSMCFTGPVKSWTGLMRRPSERTVWSMSFVKMTGSPGGRRFGKPFAFLRSDGLRRSMRSSTMSVKSRCDSYCARSSASVAPVSVRQMRGRAASSARIASASANAATASTTGTARRTMHGSWRPFIASVAGCRVTRSTDGCAL